MSAGTPGSTSRTSVSSTEAVTDNVDTSVTVATTEPADTGAPTVRVPVVEAPPAVPPSSEDAWPWTDSGSEPTSAETSLPPPPAVAPNDTMPVRGARTSSASTVACAAASASVVCCRWVRARPARESSSAATPAFSEAVACWPWARAVA